MAYFQYKVYCQDMRNYVGIDEILEVDSHRCKPRGELTLGDLTVPILVELAKVGCQRSTVRPTATVSVRV